MKDTPAHSLYASGGDNVSQMAANCHALSIKLPPRTHFTCLPSSSHSAIRKLMTANAAVLKKNTQGGQTDKTESCSILLKKSFI